MIIKKIKVSDYLTKSNLPLTDYTINPYVGCGHGCKYCYASFMKKFTGHTEDWGFFIDIKICDKQLNKQKLTGKSVFLSSVTDPYQPIEKKYQITKKILEQLVNIDCEIFISTKSSLILRDLNLLKKCKNLVVAISLNTLNESFRKDMDKGSSVKERLETMKTLHDNGIYVVMFLSPWFPGITNFFQIMESTKNIVDEYWFENLNLRGDYMPKILKYINDKYPHLVSLYDSIYKKKNNSYWLEQEKIFIKYCKDYNLKFVNGFYHTKLVKDKKKGKYIRS